MKHIFSILFLGLLLFSCQKEENSGFPDVRTIPEVIISENGVIVQIEISSHNNEIIDYGVVYSKKENIPENEYYRVSLGKFTEKGKVSVNIDRYLAKDQSYVVKAYATTRNNTIYGNSVTFINVNSKGLILKDFYPKNAFIGDTITILGEYFSPKIADNVVWCNRTQITPFFSNDTLLKVIVPVMDSSAEVNLQVETAVGTAEFKNYLSIGIPIIYDVTPRMTLPFENVKITGKGLHLINEIFLRDLGFQQIISKTDTSLVFEVGRSPKDNFFVDYKLNNDYPTYSTGEKIQIIYPQIYSVSPTLAWIDTILTVRGSHLDKLDSFALSYVGLEKVSITDSVVKLKIPDVFITSNIRGYLYYFAEIASSDIIHFNSPVVTEVSKTAVIFGDKITIKGDRFFYGLSSNFGEYQYINKNEVTISFNEFYTPGVYSLSLYHDYANYPLFDITFLSIEITELVPYEIRKGSEITIKVLNFPFEFLHNSVRVHLDNIVMIIKEINKDYITIIVPDHEANYSEYPKLTLTIGNQQIIRENALHMVK